MGDFLPDVHDSDDEVLIEREFDHFNDLKKEVNDFFDLYDEVGRNFIHDFYNFDYEKHANVLSVAYCAYYSSRALLNKEKLTEKIANELIAHRKNSEYVDNICDKYKEMEIILRLRELLQEHPSRKEVLQLLIDERDLAKSMKKLRKKQRILVQLKISDLLELYKRF